MNSLTNQKFSNFEMQKPCGLPNKGCITSSLENLEEKN